MRIDVHAVNIELPTALRSYAETRAWMAGRRHASRVIWLSVRVANRTAASGAPVVSCRIDGWLRGAGHVSVRHVDADPYVAIDRAAVRLERAVERRVRNPAGVASLAGGAGTARRTVRRLAAHTGGQPMPLFDEKHLSVWEGEGGAILSGCPRREDRRSRRFDRRREHGSRFHVVPDHRVSGSHAPSGGERRRGRASPRPFSRLRSDPAGMAAATTAAAAR